MNADSDLANVVQLALSVSFMIGLWLMGWGGRWVPVGWAWNVATEVPWVAYLLATGQEALILLSAGRVAAATAYFVRRRRAARRARQEALCAG